MPLILGAWSPEDLEGIMCPPGDTGLSIRDRVILSTVSHVPKLMCHSASNHLGKLVLTPII